MSNNKIILTNTLALHVRLLVTLVISLYSTRILLNNLGAEDFGLYGTVAGVVALISFLQISLSSATNRFLNVEMVKGDIPYIQKIFSTAFFLHIVVALFLCILIEALGVWALNSYIKLPVNKVNVAIQVLHLSVISLFIVVLTIPFEAMLMVKEKFKVYALLSIVDVALKLLLAYILVFFSNDKVLYYAFGIFCIVFLIRSTYVVYVKLKFIEVSIKFHINRDFLRQIINFISWDLYGNFSVASRLHGTALLMNNFFGLVMVASIQVSNQINAALQNLSGNLLVAVKPQLMRSYAEENADRMNQLTIYSSKYAYYLMLIFCTPIILNIDFILKLWLKFPPEYTKIIAIFMLINSLISVIFNPVIMLIHATGNVKKISFLTGTLILLSLPLVYFLFKYGFEYYYAYIVFILNSILAGILNVWIAKNLVHSFNSFKFLRVVLGNIIITTGMIIFTFKMLHEWLIVKNIMSFMGIVGVEILIVAFLVYNLGIEKKHKALIKDYLKSEVKRWSRSNF